MARRGLGQQQRRERERTEVVGEQCNGICQIGDGLLAVALPPGAFFGLALLIALRNYLSDERIDTED